MLEIDGVVLSDELLTTRFACDLDACKGNCCRYGDRGSPLVKNEGERIEGLLPQLQGYLSPRHREFLEEGVYEVSKGQYFIRELRKDTPCPLGFIKDGGILACSLHALALDRNQMVGDFKPFWCRFFPIVIRSYHAGFSVNVLFTPHCRSIPNPPLLLTEYLPDFGRMFGAAWVKRLQECLPEQL